ncbi:Olfactory receptor 10H1 [Camelus dromedarius]|uniref:Olfactory receptor 10H1 n=1 Tax=Camelus dromedarius TaxID=9838 RepID=A0A5N4CMG3_CAMDR|nr:Olfactory receptor 10H1 [Camelus dromedarius]
MYLFTLLGNLLIMSTIWSERSLHTPTYLFLWALSISESLYTFVNIPCMLTDLISTHHSISFTACASQMFFSFTFGFTHSSLLTVMGYDRYVAICHPRATRMLQMSLSWLGLGPVAASPWLLLLLAAVSWILAHVLVWTYAFYVIARRLRCFPQPLKRNWFLGHLGLGQA